MENTTQMGSFSKNSKGSPLYLRRFLPCCCTSCCPDSYVDGAGKGFLQLPIQQKHV